MYTRGRKVAFSIVSTLTSTTCTPRGYETIECVVFSRTIFGSVVVGYEIGIGVVLSTFDLAISNT
jgi:hypothetical protein